MSNSRLTDDSQELYLNDVEFLYGNEVRQKCEAAIANDPSIDLTKRDIGWEIHDADVSEKIRNSPSLRTCSGKINFQTKTS